MAEKRVIELEVQDNVKSLKAQYREAVQELQRVSQAYGETSDQAVKAARAAAELKDQIGFSKDLVDSFNPDAKFNALSRSIGGVLDGFQAFEGALGLVGVEGEAVQETMLKVQSAMALSQGVQGVMEAKDSFMQLGTVLKSTSIGQAALTAATTIYNTVVGASTGALKVFKIAMLSTGIGALVVGVGLLVANFDKVVDIVKSVVGWFSGLGDTTKNIISVMFPFIGVIRLVIAGLEELGIIDSEQDKIKKKNHENDVKRAEATLRQQEKIRKAREKSFTNEQNAYDRNIKLAQAEGKSTYELEKAKIGASIRYQETKKKELEQELLGLKIIAESFSWADKVSGGLVTQRVEELGSLIDAAANEIENQKTELKILEINKNKAASGGGGGGGSAAAKEVKEKLDLERQLRDKQIELMENPYQKERELIKERAKREKEDLAASVKDKVYNQEQYAESLKLIDEKLKKDLQDQEAKFSDNTLKTKEATLLKSNLLDLDASDQEIKLAQETAEKLKEIDEKEILRKNELRQKTLELAGNTFAALGDLAGSFNTKNEAQARRQFQVQKAFNLAAAITNTAMAVTGALTAGGNPLKLATGQQFVEAGIAGTVGLANIIKIANSRFGGGAGSSGSNAPSGAGGGGGSMTANFNTIGTSGINQLATLQQQPVQAFVVSGEVTSAQSLDRNRIQNATL